MTQELLLEIGTEEIPAGYINPALDHLKQRLTRHLESSNLDFGKITTLATPRRLTVMVTGLPKQQQDQSKEVTGPPKQAGFDKDNQPTKAAIGFAQSRGAKVEDIQIVKTDKGEYLMVVQEIKGEETADLLSQFIPELILSIPFPKSMRWADQTITFARPLQWILALFDGHTLDIDLEGLKATNTTRGHRFHSPQTVPVNSISHYLQTMEALNVVVNQHERKESIRRQVMTVAASSGGQVVLDEELLDTVTNLVEFPNAICGKFDEKFLNLPQEVLTTSMKSHQKYFTVADDKGNLLPYFVAVNNTRVRDETLSREGHQRVLRARLEDGLFFFNADKKYRLEDFIPRLSGVVFQANLGTMAEKSARIGALAAAIAESVNPSLITDTKRAAELCKADLVSDMVGEFPSLQGVMGKQYALNGGESSAVADGIEDHYRPLRAGSELPSSAIGAFLSIADRIDTMAGCFGLGKIPTGATDPYGLRRHGLALIHIIEENGWNLSLKDLFTHGLELYDDKLECDTAQTVSSIVTFLKTRYANDMSNRGIGLEAAEAALAVGFDDITDCRKRIDALLHIANHESFDELAGAFKRVTNIIKDHESTIINPDLLSDVSEKRLYQTLTSVIASCTPHLENKEYGQALTGMLVLKGDIDRFFDEVMVMAEDPQVRENRLSMLTTIAKLFLQVGDISKMYSLAQ
ncbi:MAG: glycine--tRNA ligase subunit beta [Desulfobulbaceae bacterium]|jgi:glycyl-tRNA synthetase beta chain|nr:glycine--tRNA ligase subunit beta [Desulfobulbaceae bacterium]